MMSSIAAQEVAKEVIRQVEKGGKPFITTIAPTKGYSPRTAHSGKIQKSKGYQEIMKPFTDALIDERNRAIKAMKGKISKAKYRDLVDAVDKLTKNHQLLTGNSTENIAVKPILGGLSLNGVPRDNSTE